ncbi:MAG: hypothetical protein AAGC55_30165, partial [Myxococcota bacterium]
TGLRSGLAAADAGLLFYEDLPYAGPGYRWTPALPDARAALDELGLVPGQPLSLACELAAKVALVDHYPSQIPMLFRDREQLRRTLAGVAPGQPLPAGAVERYWTARGIAEPLI